MNTSFIRTLRTAIGYTSEKMADALNLSRPTYSRIESGDRWLDAEELKSLSELTGISEKELVEFHENEVAAQKMTNPKAQAKVLARCTSSHWTRCLNSCRGDYVQARKKYPKSYRNFMTTNTTNPGGK